MGRNCAVSYEECIDELKSICGTRLILKHLAKQLKVSRWAIKRLLIAYQSLGPEGLIENFKKHALLISSERTAVIDYLVGGGSYRDRKVMKVSGL